MRKKILLIVFIVNFSFVLFGNGFLNKPQNDSSENVKIDTIAGKNVDNKVLGSDDSTGVTASDYWTVLTLDQKKYVIKMVKEGTAFIKFTYPLNEIINEMSTNVIAKIIYPDGTEKEFNNTDNNDNEYTGWENIIITYDENDIVGLFEVGEVYAKYESQRLKYNARVMERFVNEIIQKRAHRQNADIVLITNKNINRAYGEFPYIELWGTAYSNTQPLEQK